MSLGSAATPATGSSGGSRAGSGSAAVPALHCRGLVKCYGDLVAVDGLDLEVAAGECFGLLGPNGAGKTTTVELFEGLLAPGGGTLEVLGLRWKGDGQKLRARHCCT